MTDRMTDDGRMTNACAITVALLTKLSRAKKETKYQKMQNLKLHNSRNTFVAAISIAVCITFLKKNLCVLSEEIEVEFCRHIFKPYVKENEIYS